MGELEFEEGVLTGFEFDEPDGDLGEVVFFEFEGEGVFWVAFGLGAAWGGFG